MAITNEIIGLWTRFDNKNFDTFLKDIAYDQSRRKSFQTDRDLL